jgi:hypothetical protein
MTTEQKRRHVYNLKYYKEHKETIGGVFEDRQQVVDMYRARGLRVFQVDKGHFSMLHIVKRLPVRKTSKRMNNKRKCQYCKVTFLSQGVYNDHVNTCDETPKPKRRTR